MDKSLTSCELGAQFKVAFNAASNDNKMDDARTPTNNYNVSKITSRGGENNTGGELPTAVAFDLLLEQESSTVKTDDITTTTTTTATVDSDDKSVNHVFESIFSNENDFQSFLDVLEKKEFSRPENVRLYFCLFKN